jgi:hypothetical protein
LISGLADKYNVLIGTQFKLNLLFPNSHFKGGYVDDLNINQSGGWDMKICGRP